jgi:hypothetical protein
MALTKEQRQTIDEAIAPIKAEALRTDPITRDECIAAFNAVYAKMKLAAPEYVFCTSPWNALQQVEKLADPSNYRKVLGKEISLGGLDFDEPYADPLYDPTNARGDKSLMIFNDLGNVVDDGFLKYGKRGRYDFDDVMANHGFYSSWLEAMPLGRALSYEVLGLVNIPRDNVLLWHAAIATCGAVFSFERYCFVSERPESLHHPQLSKDDPRDRIIVRWRDGFVCDEELWF